jgi:hypothetical protein
MIVTKCPMLHDLTINGPALPGNLRGIVARIVAKLLKSIIF